MKSKCCKIKKKNKNVYQILLLDSVEQLLCISYKNNVSNLEKQSSSICILV